MPSGTAAEIKESDEQTIDNVLKELGSSKEAIKKHRRITKKTSENEAQAQPPIIIVEFKDNATKTLICRNAFKLRSKTAMNGIYLNEDKTLAQRTDEAKYRADARERNAKFTDRVVSDDGTEGRPHGFYKDNQGHNHKFFWAARPGKLVRIYLD
jgi:hypothetical protein